LSAALRSAEKMERLRPSLRWAASIRQEARSIRFPNDFQLLLRAQRGSGAVAAGVPFFRRSEAQPTKKERRKANATS
jgi:hypothetical protein